VSGVSQRMFTIFCRASHGQLSPYIAGHLRVNFLDILCRASHVQLSRYSVGCLTQSFLVVLSGLRGEFSRHFAGCLMVSFSFRWALE
jgi:hypothetical protein